MIELIGHTLGAYRIIEQIGIGGMATVYKAYQTSMNRYVAVKVLPRQFAESPSFMGRFEQEAHTIAKLEHAHILPVHDYGEQDGNAYLVMRLVETGTLRTPTRTPMPPTPTPKPPTDTPRPPTATATPNIPCSPEPQGTFRIIWAKYENRLGCPHQIQPIDGLFAEQPFQGGHMFWSEYGQLYLVMIGDNSGSWLFFSEDESPWKEGMPPISCEVDVPAGLYQPIRGFGGLWCATPDVREQIGWATDIERGFENGMDLIQGFEGGIVLRDGDGFNRGLAYVLFWDDMSYVRDSY